MFNTLQLSMYYNIRASYHLIFSVHLFYSRSDELEGTITTGPSTTGTVPLNWVPPPPHIGSKLPQQIKSLAR